MRLRLFRGRAWWPGRDQRVRPSTEADGQVAAPQSRQPAAQQPRQPAAQQSRQPAAYPRGARGSHRKSGRARTQTEPELRTAEDQASAGQNGWPVRDRPAQAAPLLAARRVMRQALERQDQRRAQPERRSG